jgi:hypothetical protein
MTWTPTTKWLDPDGVKAGEADAPIRRDAPIWLGEATREEIDNLFAPTPEEKAWFIGMQWVDSKREWVVGYFGRCPNNGGYVSAGLATSYEYAHIWCGTSLKAVGRMRR